MGLRLFINKLFKKIKLEKESDICSKPISLEAVSSLERKFDELEKNGITCDHEPIKGVFPMYKIISNNPSYYREKDNKGITWMYDNYLYNIIMTPNEFTNCFCNEKVTYKDVISTIKNNNNIKSKEKNILIEGIKNLEKDNLNIDLRILNYNLKRLKIVYKELDNVDVAQYVVDENTVYIDSTKVDMYGISLYKRILLHEILGHASNMSYNKDSATFCTTHMMCMFDGGNDRYGFNIYGQSLDEAIAEIITESALGKKFDSYNSPYLPFMYELLILCKCVNITINDYIKHGMQYLINKLKENDLQEGIILIQLFEQKYTALITGGIDYNIDNGYDDVIIILLKKLAYINYSNNIDLDNNLNQLLRIINSYKPYIATRDDKIFTGTTEQNYQELDFNYIREEITNFINRIYSFCTKNESVQYRFTK